MGSSSADAILSGSLTTANHCQWSLHSLRKAVRMYTRNWRLVSIGKLQCCNISSNPECTGSVNHLKSKLNNITNQLWSLCTYLEELKQMSCYVVLFCCCKIGSLCTQLDLRLLLLAKCGVYLAGNSAACWGCASVVSTLAWNVCMETPPPPPH